MNKQHSANFASIRIRIGSSVRVDYNTTFRAWYHSDDGFSWFALPRNITNAQTAIERACMYYGIKADNV